MFGFNFNRRPKSDPVQLIAREETRDAQPETRGAADGWSLTDPSDMYMWLALGGGAPTLAGVDVGPESAMRCAAVKCAVELIAGVCSTLPVHVHQTADAGGSELATDHPAYVLTHDEANGWTSAGAFRAQLTQDALLFGDGLGYVVRDGVGQPRELIRLYPSACTIELDPITLEPQYRYNATSQERIFSYSDIIHIRPLASLNYLGLRGLAPIRSAAEAIALSIALERYASRLMGSGGRPSGVITVEGTPSPEKLTRLKAAWQAATTGCANGGTAVLDSTAKWQPLSFSSVDAQFQQMREFQVIEIARAFGLPPSLLQDLGRATWANAVQTNKQVVVYTLQHWFRQWEDAYNRVLLTPVERKAGTSAHFDLDSLLQGDLAARANAYSTLIAARVMNPNEAREREHLPSYAEGDQFQNPNTMAARPFTRIDLGDKRDDG